MHPLLVDYFYRFTKEKPFQFQAFFTSFNTENYVSNIPLLCAIEPALFRLYEAIKKQERICIYSDYDTDAVTATGVMYWGLIALGMQPENIGFYAPDRFTEGYGMNPEAVAQLAQEYDLIVSVDCGINSTEEADIIKSFQKDLIITDHHHLHGNLPQCISVVNPRLSEYYQEKAEDLVLSVEEIKMWSKRTGLDAVKIENWCKKLETIHQPSIDPKNTRQFLSHSVTGVGVAWFVVLWLGYFMEEFDQISSGWRNRLNALTSLVAIGTIADCQSILDPTNRLITRVGIQMMQKGNHGVLGLEELLKQIGLREKIAAGYQLTSQEIAFYLAPILNSSGRITHAHLSIEVMLAPTSDVAFERARELIQINEQRKQMVREITEEVDTEAAKQVASHSSIIWLEGDWGKGVVGLLASRLVSRYHVPVVVVSLEQTEEVEELPELDTSAVVEHTLKQEGTGNKPKVSASLRAPEGYHLPNAMQAASEFLEKFGGHPGAAGFHTLQENLPQVRTFLEKALAHQSKNMVVSSQVFTPKDIQPLVPSEMQNLQSEAKFIWLEGDKLDASVLNSVLLMDPFSQDFPFPRFIIHITNTITNVQFRWLGVEQKHVKIHFGSGQSVVIFNLTEEQRDELINQQEKDTINLWIEAKITQNTWNGSTKVELIGDEMHIV